MCDPFTALQFTTKISSYLQCKIQVFQALSFKNYLQITNKKKSDMFLSLQIGESDLFFLESTLQTQINTDMHAYLHTHTHIDNTKQ